ncbi:MAG: histidinol dehydrogenase, partial [Mesorhizobium sp.]
MIRILKSGRSAEAKATDASAVRGTVERVLIDVEARGDVALRELSETFDRWSPPSFRLSKDEIDACLAALSPRQLDDIQFAQTQIRRFAE